MKPISRREFVALAAAGAAAAPRAASQKTPRAAITAQEVLDRIQKNIGIPWKPDTVDTFKAGDPTTTVTGIVTTAMATLSVLRQAVKAGANLVVSCEPTFYGRADRPTPPAGRGGEPAPPDPVFAGKADFVNRNDLVVVRFSDHWRARRPDPLAEGLAGALGWKKYADANDPARLSIPATTLDALASHVKENLNARGGIRVVGDPQTRVQRIGLLPGTTPIQASLSMLPDVDLVIAGEVREWESVEYARDTVTAGVRKGLMLLGRVLSEEPGTNACARWLQAIVPEVSTTWIRAGDPYWRPA